MWVGLYDHVEILVISRDGMDEAIYHEENWRGYGINDAVVIDREKRSNRNTYVIETTREPSAFDTNVIYKRIYV